MKDRFEQFTLSVSRIFQSMQKIQRHEMAAYGLKSAHVVCLLSLYEHPSGVTAARLAQLCEKDKAAISRTVTELEQAGMVLRTAKNAGGYRAMLQLTAEGRTIAEQVREKTILAVEQAGSGISDTERNILYAALERIADNLQYICRDGLNILDGNLQEELR